MIVLRPVSRHIYSCTNFGARATTCPETCVPEYRGRANTEETSFKQIMV